MHDNVNLNAILISKCVKDIQMYYKDVRINNETITGIK